MAGKRYYWLKLHDDFFDSKRIKKLRRMAGGDTCLIIYLKMQLMAMKSDGMLKWTGLEESFADELALDLDENPDNVKVVLAYLLSCGLAETSDNISFFLPYTVSNVGSEGSSAQRMRDIRAKQVAQSVTLCALSDGEKEIEIDTRDRDKSNGRFAPPTLAEVKAYCNERGNNIDAQRFIDYYTSNGWMVGKNKMKDWKAAVRTWERKDGNVHTAKPAGQDTGGDKAGASKWKLQSVDLG